MDPKLLDAYIMALWGRLVQAATAHNALAMEAGTGTLPVPEAPWVMVTSFIHTGVVTALPSDSDRFMAQLDIVVGDLVEIYLKDLPSLMEIAAAKGGKLGVSMKLAQRIHEVASGSVVTIKA